MSIGIIKHMYFTNNILHDIVSLDKRENKKYL